MVLFFLLYICFDLALFLQLHVFRPWTIDTCCHHDHDNHCHHFGLLLILLFLSWLCRIWRSKPEVRLILHVQLIVADVLPFLSFLWLLENVVFTLKIFFKSHIDTSLFYCGTGCPKSVFDLISNPMLLPKCLLFIQKWIRLSSFFFFFWLVGEGGFSVLFEQEIHAPTTEPNV